MSASGKMTKTLVWILMGLLILGLGGFGITNLGGSVRTVGQVGDKPITTQSYARALQQTLRSQTGANGRPLTMAEAQERGVDTLILSQLMAERTLDHEASALGFSVGDERLAQQIVNTDAFQGIDGTFNREDYRFSLDQIGLSEREYEELVREELSRGILESAVFTDIPTSGTYAETLLSYIGERRDFTWAFITESELDAPLPEASDDELRAFHKENTTRYMSPNIRKITFAWVSPEQMIDQVEVDDATVRELYEDRAEEYNRPERRLVERLVYTNAAAAEAAAAKLADGSATFESLVEERGLALGDVDMGDVDMRELEGAGEAVFAAAAGDVVGPVETPLGAALFRVNAVLAAQVTEFDEVKDELRDEFAQGRARRLIDGQIDTYEDLLIGGATLEELAAETEMKLGTIDWHGAAEGGPAGFAAFRAAADSVTLDDFPELIALEDGGQIAIRLDGEVAAELQDFETVRDDVVRDERAARLEAALTAKAETLAAQLGEGRQFTALDVTPIVEEGLTRTEFIQDAPRSLMTEVFALKSAGAATVVSGGNIAALVQLDGISAPDESNPDLAGLRQAFSAQYSNDLAQDIYQVFVTDIQGRVPIALDQNAINAVNTTLQ